MSGTEQKVAEVGGAKVTINPSEQIVKAATKEASVTDSLGRVIRLKKPTPLANLDFAKAAGSDRLNVLYLAEVAHLKFVAAIDDQPVATPSTEGELRALYQRLGDEGNEAAVVGVSENFMGTAASDGERDEIKK
jgi:tetrahydromethanopterin S-methyltransferase subunit H